MAEDESTRSNNTTAEYAEPSKSENANKSNSVKSENEEYLSLNDGLEYAYPSGDQTAPNEESLVKETDLSVDDLRAQMASL